MAEAYEVLSKRRRAQLYDRYGHAGLRSGGFRPPSSTSATSADLFSAFFGDDLFGGGGRARRARGQRRRGEVEIDLVEAARGRHGEVPFEVAVACDALRRRRRRAGHDVTTCPTCGGAGRVQQVSRSVFGEFVRRRVPDVRRRRAASIEHAVQRRAAERAAASKSARSTSTSRPGSTTASASALGRGPRRQPRCARRRRLRRRRRPPGP